MTPESYDFSHWGEKLPKASCLCPTYGRPHLIGEAIESFRRQDYSGEKELIILNDHPEMVLSLPELEGVKLVNSPTRYPSLGEKRNALAAMATGDLFFPWDDDDICLPNRLSTTIERMTNHHYFKPSDLWWWTGSGVAFRHGVMAHAMCGYSREIFERCGGYPHTNSGEDQGFDNKIARLGYWSDSPLGSQRTFYIYRLNHVQTYHISNYAFGSGWKECENKVKGSFTPGSYPIFPVWNHPYENLVRQYVDERTGILTAEPGKPLLSICISIKNRSLVQHTGEHLKLFPRCVASISKAAGSLGPIELVVADFGSDDWPLDAWLNQVGKGLQIRHLRLNEPFSRGRGLNLAAVAAKSPNLFLSDADILVGAQALEDGIRAVRMGEASFPIIRHLREDGSKADSEIHGYGLAFISKALFKASGGIPEFHSWGGEDNLFYDRVRRLTGIRRETTDDLLHQWHPDDLKDRYYSHRRRSDFAYHTRKGREHVPLSKELHRIPDSIRIFQACHPHWQGFIHLRDDGRFCRAGIEGGRHEWIEDRHLILHWDAWPPEKLLWCPEDNLYRAPEKAFTLAEIAPAV